MKILARKRAANQGMAVMVVMILLAILLIYITGNARTLHHLGRELRLIEKHQQQRLNSPSRTNVVAVVKVAPFPVAAPQSRPQ